MKIRIVLTCLCRVTSHGGRKRSETEQRITKQRTYIQERSNGRDYDKNKYHERIRK